MPDIRLNIVGSNPPESVKRYASEHINIKGFVSDEELQQLYDQSRLCVIPLRYGAGVKGKTIERCIHVFRSCPLPLALRGFRR